MAVPNLAEYVRYYRSRNRVIQRLKRDIKGALFRGAHRTVQRLRRHLAAQYKISFRRALDFYFQVFYQGRRPAWARRIVPVRLQSAGYYDRLAYRMRMYECSRL